MLVLTRRVGEEIVIANDIRVTVVAVKGKQVRLGITAPASVNVVRQELCLQHNRSAASPTAGGTGEDDGHGSASTSSAS
jgi:carbon storage regulator